MTAKSLRRNHIKLAKFHIGLGLFNSSFMALVIYIATRPPEGRSFSLTAGDAAYLLFIICLPLLIHLPLALGSWRKWKVTRYISILIGAGLFLGFPIGTFVSVFFLPLTDWEPDSTDAPREPWTRPRAGNLAAS